MENISKLCAGLLLVNLLGTASCMLDKNNNNQTESNRMSLSAKECKIIALCQEEKIGELTRELADSDTVDSITAQCVRTCCMIAIDKDNSDLLICLLGAFKNSDSVDIVKLMLG